jgi:GT2 family glycosyltransferase
LQSRPAGQAADLYIKEACQEAIKKAYGEYVCLLNNDTVVTANLR